MTILETSASAVAEDSNQQLVVAKKSSPWDSFLANSKVPQGHTDELLTWLSKVNQKKQSIRSTRHRDLRKEAMLENARLSAQAALELKQRERMQRWRMIRTTVTTSPPSSPTGSLMSSSNEGTVSASVDDNLCDCDSCVLCQRHRSSMYGKCYCNVIFSPRPVFMDFNSPIVSATDAFSEDEDSIQVDNFLASLSLKRKSSALEQEQEQQHQLASSSSSRKRAKA